MILNYLQNFNETTLTAIKTLKSLIQEVSSQRNVDTLSRNPNDVLESLIAFSRLQHISNHYERTFLYRKSLNQQPLFCELAHYAVFASAAYGWKMGLLTGKWYGGKDIETLIKKTGLKEKDIIMTSWKSQTNLPAFYIVREDSRKKLVLCIRGTFTANDLLTDLCCIPKEFTIETINGKKGYDKNAKGSAHQGMLESAIKVAKQTKSTISYQLAMYQNYNLVIVGHSLGGGTAAILGTMWKEIFPGVTVYAYGCPCVGPLYTYPTKNQNIISVIGNGDPFSCLSIGHVVDLSCAISKLCQNPLLRTEIVLKTENYLKVEDMNISEQQWCSTKMKQLRQETMVAKKMYPAGRIIYVEDIDNIISLYHLDQGFFHELKLHPYMFDLSKHIPKRYEMMLQRVIEPIDINKEKKRILNENKYSFLEKIYSKL